MSDFIEQLRKILDESGMGRVMPDEEFEAWWKESEAYQDSPQGRMEDALEGARLTYYLDKIARYKFTDGMGEISGFGGNYEKACRVMLDSGLQWFDEHPDASPKFKGNDAVYGLIIEDNDDATALSDVVTRHIDGCSGAMHHAVVSTCLWIKQNGWDAYVVQMGKEQPNER